MSNRSSAILPGNLVADEIRDARLQLGWSLSDAARELSRAAAADGVQLPDVEALRRQLIRWERGGVVPGSAYRDLLARVYQLPLHDTRPAVADRSPVAAKTALQAARLLRGWSLGSMVRELSEVAAEAGSKLPAPPSLKRQVIRWESGMVVPSDFYRELLCRLYAAPAVALGIGATPAAARVVLVTKLPPQPRASQHSLNLLHQRRDGRRVRYHACLA